MSTGSYQPSNEMMLKFYSLFKQASEGPCTQRKPAFYNVVNRAKWESWNALGNMSKEAAMEKYVNELKKIVETMSLTDTVAEFVGSIAELDNVDVDDLEKVAPEAIQAARSRPNSPFASRNASPQHLSNGTAAYMNGTMESDDEFNSADESEIPKIHRRQHQSSFKHHGHDHDDDAILQEIIATTDAMSQSLQKIHSKFTALEQNVIELKKNQSRVEAYRRIYPKWWPFKEISPKLFLFIILWPVVANRLLNTLNNRRK